MDITAADTAGLDPDQHVFWPDLRVWHVPVFKEIVFLQHQCFYVLSRPFLPGLQSPFEGLDLPLQAPLPSGDAEDEGEGQDPENGVGGEEINQIPHFHNLLSVSLVHWETGGLGNW
jgi:hypothetical protein